MAELKQMIPENSQGRITMAAGVARNPKTGALVKLIGTSDASGYLRPGVELVEDEVMAEGPRRSHAEADIARYAKANGLQLLETAATRPICPSCVMKTFGAGGIPVGPLKIGPLK